MKVSHRSSKSCHNDLSHDDDNNIMPSTNPATREKWKQPRSPRAVLFCLALPSVWIAWHNFFTMDDVLSHWLYDASPATSYPADQPRLPSSVAAARLANGMKENLSTAGRPSRDSIEEALRCLGIQQLNSTTLPRYPNDPFDHYQKIHQHLAPWNSTNTPWAAWARYRGPWIENRWAIQFLPKAAALDNHHFPEVFGPYIPLLIPWTDIFMKFRKKYPTELIQALREVLEPDVIYITVCQNANGLPGGNEMMQQLFEEYNILVLSSGGHGHVAIPLLKQEENVLPKIPVGDRAHLLSFVGANGSAPWNLRESMISHPRVYWHKGHHWKSVKQDSKFSLCPRGYGRTSFHFMETLQMGLIPIHVYIGKDIPWIPYATTVIPNVSFSVSIEEFDTLVKQLEEISDAQIERMEQEIVGLRQDFFTYDGVIAQIELFLSNPRASALVCQPLPQHSGVNIPKHFSRRGGYRVPMIPTVSNNTGELTQ